VVVLAQQTAFYYWVHERIWAFHRARLDQLGIRSLGTKTFTYHYGSRVSARFTSGEELLMTKKGAP
jgi:hypothetical protein